eukprot:m.49609 g.49609  ORF g.49609 m.49609 type:complete len:64 (-) comp7461_c2_seq1:791-982(-)
MDSTKSDIIIPSTRNAGLLDTTQNMQRRQTPSNPPCTHSISQPINQICLFKHAGAQGCMMYPL